MTDDERLARNMAKLDAQRAIRERAIAAVQSQRDTAAGKRDEYGNPPTRKRPAKKKVRRAVTTHTARDPRDNRLAQEGAERRARIVELYQEGKETDEIAALTGIRRSTVYDHLRMAGVKLRPRNEALARRVCELYAAGKSTREVAALLGIHRTTVHGALKSAGIAVRKVQRDDLDNARLAELYERGATCAEIAGEFGVAVNTVYNRLKAAGVTMRIAGPRAAA